MASAKALNRKRTRKKLIAPRTDDKKTTNLMVGMKLELFWEPTSSWSSATILWNWNDGSYVIKCADDTEDAALTYYIDQYKYRYEVEVLETEDEPPKKKRKLTSKKKKTTKKKKKKKEKPEKAKLMVQKVIRSKKRPKKKSVRKVIVRREPNYNRGRIEKLFEEEINGIDDIEDSFYDFAEKMSLSYGLRRLSLESFRAVNISDEKLIKNIFIDKGNVADPWINWSCNVHQNCLDLAIKKGNIAMVELLLKLKKKSKYAYNRIALPSNRLRVSSGHVGAATFGHRVRKVKASRGGKEGNNAFIKDETVHVRSLQDHFDYALEIGSNYDLIQLLMKELHKNGLPRPIQQVSDHGLLYKAAAYGHIDIVRKYIALLSQHDGDGKSWGLNELHTKVIQEHYIDLGEFRNVSVTKKALEGNNSITPLHLAAINPDINYLKQMVEQSNIVDHTDDLRRTPLFFAAACSSPEPLRYLISKGAKLDVRGLVSRDNAEDEISPLLIAVKYDKAHNIALLLGDITEDKEEEEDKKIKYGELVNESLDPRSNKKLIHVAAYYGNADVVAELLEYGANPKAVMKGTRLTALHLAAQFGHLEACKILIEHRLAQKNKRALLAKDNHKRIPMILAIMNGHLNVVKYMLSIGSPSYTTDSSGNSAIHYAAAYGWNDILKCLMEAPFANPGVFNMWKLSPFFIGMIKGNDLCASTLLDTKDFDVNAVDSEGKSILHYMLENKNFNPDKSLTHLKRIVSDLGANVNVIMPKTKETPLHILANNTPSDKDGEMAHILMEKGARPDYQDINGQSPLSLAIQHQNFTLFEAFVLKFDVNIAGKPKKSIDWKKEEEKARLGLNTEEEPVQEQEKKQQQEDEEELSKELNLNTSVSGTWLTPLMMAIQLNPPDKAAKKPKERKRKKKKQKKQQTAMPQSANIGGFGGSTFHQQIHFDSNGSENSDEESEDEEEKLKQKQKEEEEEKERNEPGETTKQRQFREKRLHMIRLICTALKKYDDNSTKSLNTFCKNGHNALFYAVRCQCYQGTDGYKINYGSVEITNALMEMGADPDTMNESAETVISYILENMSSNINVIQILTPILNVANVNKELVIYDEKKITKSKDKKDKIKVRRNSYLTTAINQDIESDEKVMESTKYGIIKLLIEKGAKLEIEDEIPAMIEIIKQCQYDEMFDSQRFETKNPESKENSIGFQLICLVLELAQNVNLNIVDKPKDANAKSLLSFVIDLIKKECQSKQNALFNQINLVENNYLGRDTRVIDHKKRLYRDHVLAIPLISEAILQTLLSFKKCKIEINEKTILEAIKLSSLEGALKSHNLFDESLKKDFEPISLRVCKMLLQYGNVNLNTYDDIPNKVYNPLIDALDGTNKDLTRKLLQLLIVDHKMNINRQDKRGVTLVHAIEQYDYQSIQLMVENGLNVNNSGWSTYHVDDEISDKPNKIGKHPVVELVELGAGHGHKHNRYRPEMLDAILSQKGIDVELQNEFCVTLTKKDCLLCTIQYNAKTIGIEFVPYKYKNEEDNKWMLTKTFCVDHLALFAYKSAYQLFKKHYKQNMDKRFSSPLWKQAIEILINCQWSLSKATKLFKQFKFKLSEAIKQENNRRKLIREKFKNQVRYIAKIHKNKNKKEVEEEEKRMDLDDDDNDDDDDDAYDMEMSPISISSLDSEERNAIDSDDEMKKLEDYKSELKSDIDPEAIKEIDLAPLITVLCKDWKYTKQQYDGLVNKWYYAHRELVVGDAAWQLCREQARNDERQRRRTAAIDEQRKKIKHLRDLRKQLKDDNTKYNMDKMIRNKANVPDFSILEERDTEIEEWKKAKKHGEPPLISEHDLEKINGVDCTQKLGSQEIKNSFKAQTKTLRFTQSEYNKYHYQYDGDEMAKELEPNALFYCIAHNKEQGDSAKSQSLGYLYILPSIYDVKSKKNNIYVEIAKHSNCKKDGLELIKTYYRHKGDLNATDKDNKTMIMHAISNNNLELIEWLLSKKVDLNNRSHKMQNNILHVAMNHIHKDKSLNIRQLLHCIIDNIKYSNHEKQKILKELSNQYNADGYTPLLLAIKQFAESKADSAKNRKYVNYFKHKKAMDEWYKKRQDLDEEREELKKQNLEKWYKEHPIDYIEIDLDEIDFDIVCAEWKVSPKPIPTSTAATDASVPSLFDNLNTQDQDILMSSQPLSEHEDEEKEHEDKEKEHEDEDEDEQDDTKVDPMDVTKKIKELVSDDALNIGQYTDLHEIFDTKDWDDRKWTLEVTYSIGDYMATVITEQNEEPDEDENVQQYNMWGGYGYGATNTSGFKLTKTIDIPKTRDRIKQVYHYRLTNVFKKYKKPTENILDHIDFKCDGKEHQTYVYLCKKLRIKPQFAYPIPLRKPKSRVKDKRQKDYDESESDVDVDVEVNDYYEFKNDRDDILTDDAESESDYELPSDPPAVIYAEKPKTPEEFSTIDFLSEFVKRCFCDVDKQTKLAKSYIDKLEKERKEIETKTDEEFINLSARERSSYFAAIKLHKLKLWNIDAPWLRENKFEIRFTGFSPLHYASYFGNFDLVKLFVSLGTNPNLITYESNATALMIHCNRANDTNIVNEILSDKRCNVNISDIEGFTALTFAVNFSGRHLHDAERSFRETFQIERILLKHNANINHQDIYGRTAAHYIFVSLRQNRCYGSRDPIELVSDLCSAGHKDKKVNVDISDMYGRSPIHYAAMLGAQISSNWLTKEGAKVKGYPDFWGNEPFQHTILNKQIALSVDYINQGVDVKHMLFDYKTYKERSSFRQCLELKWMGVAYLMVSRGVEITLAVDDALETENYQLAKTLLYKTQSMNLRNRTPEHEYTLHHIVSKYSPKTFQSKNAFEDPWSVRIIEILDEQNVESKDVLDKFGMTPLHYAVLNGHCNLARHYIEKNKLNPERVDGIKNERPLVTALYNNDIIMVKMLVQIIRVDVTKKISPKNTRKDGNTFPIHIAVTNNNYEICKILLNNGSSTKHEYEARNRRKAHGNGDTTILHSAIRKNNYELTKLILEHNANVHSTLSYDDLKGYSTCLHLACSKRDKRLIELLIAYKCKINEVLRYSNIKPLDESSEKAREKDLPRWKNEFRKIHEIDCLDECALHIVCRRFNNYALTKLLIEYNADVNKVYRKELLFNRHENSKKLWKLFNISTRNDHPDLCLLHSMVRNRNHEMVELLLEHGADPNIKMYRRIEHQFGEQSALHTAVRHNDIVCAELLLKSKANPNELYITKNCKSSDLSPIHTAIRSQNGEMVKLLLKSGSDPNQRMISENSESGEVYGIQISVENQDIEITQNLLKHGADPNVKLFSKRTIYGDVVPIHVAVRFGNYSLVQLLLLYGANPNIKLQPKKEKEIIWKWRSNAGNKEYDKILNILIEKQYQSYLAQQKEKQTYLKQINEANKNLTNKRKPDAEKIKAFDAKIQEKSQFYLRRGSFFENNDGYFINFNNFRQQNEGRKDKYRTVIRYQHPEDVHKDGGSALWMAVRNRDLHIISLLVNYHCDMNVTNNRLETPLIYAIKKNDLTLAAILMRGAVYYNTKYKEKIYRGVGRRKQYQYNKDHDDDIDDDDDDDVDMTTTKKRTRSRKESDIHRWTKKRKTSKNTALLIDDDRWKDIKFVPINVCLKDKKHGFTALHHAVITDGIYNASFENETMLQLLVNGDTEPTKHLLESKVDTVTPFKNELSDEEVKETDWSKPQTFESKSRIINVNIEDNDGNAAIYYSLLQSSDKMRKCLEDLGARINGKIKDAAQQALDDKSEKDKKDKKECLNKLYGDNILNVSYDVKSDARKWRNEFFIEEDEDIVDAEEIEVDSPAKKEIGKKGYVLRSGGDIFNWDGLYVNVDKGKYGAYMFYKLQLLYKPIQKLTILWCRWGRPGEIGNFQRTPYQDKDEAIKEFIKIFESKTLNKWQDRKRDKFIPKKWRMVRKKRKRHKISSHKKSKTKEDLTPHNLVNSIKEILRTLQKQLRPKTELPQEIENLIYTIFDTAALAQSRRRLGLNDDIQSLGYLEDEDLDKCYQLIQNISVLVKEQDQQNIKSNDLQNKKYKSEKEIRERNTTKERNKNVFLRNEQRSKQEITRLNALIRTLKTKKTNIEKVIEKMVDADENCTQKVTLKSIETELKTKEEERKSKQEKLDEISNEEEKRKTEEKSVFDPLDESDKKEIQELEIKLNELNKLTEERRKRISHLSNEYYLLMPRREFRDTYITAIDHRSLVNKYLKIMMSLSEHQIAISALMAAQYKYLNKVIHPIDYCYISLKCKILPLLTDSYQFKLILSYINRTASPVINGKRVKIYEIWKENEEKQFETFRNYDNRMLLWHGSDTSNVCGILSSGLKVAPPEADATGYMFGRGIYFADSFQKSKNYASTGNRRNASNLKFLFLCQVALGKMYEAITAEYMEEPKQGFNSTKGLGRRGPNPQHIKTSYRGEIIPDSPTINYPQRTTRDKENKIVPVPFFLNWNEYVIYEAQKAKLKYLIMLQ